MPVNSINCSTTSTTRSRAQQHRNNDACSFNLHHRLSVKPHPTAITHSTASRNKEPVSACPIISAPRLVLLHSSTSIFEPLLFASSLFTSPPILPPSIDPPPGVQADHTPPGCRLDPHYVIHGAIGYSPSTLCKLQFTAHHDWPIMT